MSQAKIRAAFETRLAAWAATKSLPVAYENASFTQPAEAYVRVFVLPAATTSETMDVLHRGYKGVIQVTVVLPLDAGSQQAQGIAAELDALLPMPGFNHDGIRVNMTAPMSMRPAIKEEGRYAFPISGNYRVDTV